MRVGLIGTGYWARTVHGPSVAAHPIAELVGIWGRDQSRAAQLAADLQTHAVADVDALLGDVDALTFAVPPDVQAPIATHAAEQGVHLFLEKPIALSAADARRLEDAAAAGGVASIVFFTRRFVPETHAWLARVTERGDWYCGRAESDLNLFDDSSDPFASSAWRRERGALWDVGPHALSLLIPVLGEVTAVSAVAGRGDQVHLILRHAENRSSTASVSFTSPAVRGNSLYVDGIAGREMAPMRALSSADSIAAYQAAMDALIDQSLQREPSHPCDVHFGARVVEVLAAAQHSLASGCVVEVGREV